MQEEGRPLPAALGGRGEAGVTGGKRSIGAGRSGRFPAAPTGPAPLPALLYAWARRPPVSRGGTPAGLGEDPACPRGAGTVPGPGLAVRRQ